MHRYSCHVEIDLCVHSSSKGRGGGVLILIPGIVFITPQISSRLIRVELLDITAHDTTPPPDTALSSSMAKSSKKQCRTPKPQRQGGGLVVVTARNLTARSSKPPPVAGKKGKKRKKQGSLLGDLTIDESDEFDESTPGSPPQPLLASGTRTREYMFSSAHSRVQRLCYLLSTRPQARGEEACKGKGSSGGTEEGGCHAVVFVERAAVAQELVAELKALGLQAFVLHERTPKAQVSVEEASGRPGDTTSQRALDSK